MALWAAIMLSMRKSGKGKLAEWYWPVACSETRPEQARVVHVNGLQVRVGAAGQLIMRFVQYG